MSIPKESKIMIMKPNGEIYRGRVDNFMDPFFTDFGSELKSEIKDISNHKIIAVSPKNEKTSWAEISQISRHPANGKLVRVKTRSGRKTCATLSHSFLKRTSSSGIVPVKGSELKIGDYIPVIKKAPVEQNTLYEFEGYELDKDFGWFIGTYLADGNVNYYEVTISKIIPEFYKRIINTLDELNILAEYQQRDKRHNTYGPEGKTKFNDKRLSSFLVEHFGNGSENKKISSFVFQSNLDFISGIIGGYFDGDGNFNQNKGKQMIRSSSISETLTEDMILLLSYFGIFGSKCVEKKVNHTIQIPRKYANIFREKIELTVKEKKSSLDIMCSAKQPIQEFIDVIPEISPLLNKVTSDLMIPNKHRSNGPVGRVTLERYIKEFEKIANEKNITKRENLNLLKQVLDSDVVWDKIIEMEILEDPKEYVYDFTVPNFESFMVDLGVFSHNTLNSVDYHTKLLVDWTAENPPPVPIDSDIGYFIDEMIEKYPEKVQLQPDGQTIYMPLEKGTAKAMSTDEDGNILWTELQAITRHPPINKDGSKTLIKVTTESGRSVICTKAKSFLTMVDGKLKETEGSFLKLGDSIPITGKIESQNYRKTLNLQSVLDPRKHVFTDNMIYAKNVLIEANKNGPKTPWFSKIKHMVPYNRSDSLRVTIERAMIHNDEDIQTINKRANRITGNKHKEMFIPGLVYPKSWAVGPCKVSGIPSVIPLDRDFGFLIGSYLAEGCLSKHQVGIANNDENYRKMAMKWADRNSLTWRLNGGDENGNGTELRGVTSFIHSTLLRDLLEILCGNGSYNKRVPSFSFSAPDEFVIGLLDAYICGDGTVTETAYVTLPSRSKSLRDGISHLLSRFDIRTKLSVSKLVDKKDQKDPTGTLKDMYHTYISVHEVEKMSKLITVIDYKRDRIINKLKKGTRKDNRKFNTFNEVLMDPIIKIEEYESSKPFVYDLTVEKTKNMVTIEGVHIRDKCVPNRERCGSRESK